MKKKIHIITTSRADFTIWLPIIKCFIQDNQFDIKVVVTGTHYFEDLGLTYTEVKNNISDSYLTEIPVGDNAKNYEFLSNIFNKYNEILRNPQTRPELVLILGDRYELLPILNALILNRVPIGHLYPAECDISYCIDTQIRDAITKSAHLFFVPHQDYSNRLIAMGEEGWRISVTGNSNLLNDLSIHSDSIYSFLKERKIHIPEHMSLVNCCYHPPTWKKGFWKKELPSIIEALSYFQDKYVFLWTGINSDPDSSEMKEYLLKEIQNQKNHIYFDSLGGSIYHSLLQNAKFTIGNSSSGLYEAPIYKCPTINVGVRQGGRLHGKSVIDINAKVDLITEAIKDIDCIKESDFKNVFFNKEYPNNIIEHIKSYLDSPNLMLKKLHSEFKTELERVPNYL